MDAFLTIMIILLFSISFVCIIEDIHRHMQIKANKQVNIEIGKWKNEHTEDKEEWTFIKNRFNKVN